MFSNDTIKDNLLFFSTAPNLRKPAFLTIERMNYVHPSHQLLGTAVALVAMAEACGVPMRDLIVRAETVMRDVDSCNAEHIKAIRDYAKNELPRHRK